MTISKFVVQTFVAVGVCLGGAGLALAEPMLSRLDPTADGYALVGRGFGTDKDKLRVFEGDTEIYAVLSLTDSRITMKSKPSGTVQHKVQVGSQTSNIITFTHPVAPAAPTLTRVESTSNGYALVGRDFGSDTTKVQAFEGPAAVRPERIISVAGDRIVVLSTPAGTVEHKVVVAGLASGVVRFTHGHATDAPSRAKTAGSPPPAVVAPTLSAVQRTSDGYALVGRGFGTDKTRVQAYEGSVVLAADRLASVTDDRIAVRSRPSGAVVHRVVLDGKPSEPLTFDHQTGMSLSLRVTPVSVIGGRGEEATGTVTLGAAAPAGGTTVSVSTFPGASATATTMVPEGQTSTSFKVHGSSVTSPQSGAVSVTAGRATARAAFMVLPASAASLAVSKLEVWTPGQAAGPPVFTNSTTAGGPATVFGVVTLNTSAQQDVVVSLSSNNPAVASVPSTMTVPRRSATWDMYFGGPDGVIGDFVITTRPVTTRTLVTIAATYGGIMKTAHVEVRPIAIQRVALNTASITGGQPVRAWVSLNSIAPAAGVVVSLASSNTALGVPPTLSIRGGDSEAQLTITTAAVTTLTPVTVDATFGGVSTTAQLELRPMVEVSSVSFSPASVIGGQTVAGTVRLTAPAPAGGAIVNLFREGRTDTTTLPGQVTVPAGQNAVQFSVTTFPVTTADTVTIGAIYAGVQRRAPLELRPDTR
ncbi:MAG TPA: hypothetical protein VGT02_00635 [Methylomirabilota bacterium]|jgi:hypothetical protein|nr:hypothetical protein [Methylomirabilota bacterium]